MAITAKWASLTIRRKNGVFVYDFLGLGYVKAKVPTLCNKT